jgi:hypothetical protein
MIKVKLYGYEAIITPTKIISEDRITRLFLEPFLEFGITEGPQYGPISYLEDAFKKNIKLISIDEDENLIY